MIFQFIKIGYFFGYFLKKSRKFSHKIVSRNIKSIFKILIILNESTGSTLKSFQFFSLTQFADKSRSSSKRRF